MVVTTNVSNRTIMMACAVHITHHCIFTKYGSHLYKGTEAYWHICKCIKISTIHHKYEYEKRNISWAYVAIQIRLIWHALHAHVHPINLRTQSYARVHAPTCTNPEWHTRIMHTKSHSCSYIYRYKYIFISTITYELVCKWSHIITTKLWIHDITTQNWNYIIYNIIFCLLFILSSPLWHGIRHNAQYFKPIQLCDM